MGTPPSRERPLGNTQAPFRGSMASVTGLWCHSVRALSLQKWSVGLPARLRGLRGPNATQGAVPALGLLKNKHLADINSCVFALYGEKKKKKKRTRRLLLQLFHETAYTPASSVLSVASSLTMAVELRPRGHVIRFSL